MQDVFSALHSISLAGLNLNIQLLGLYFSMRDKGNLFLQTFTNVYLFDGPFSYTVLNKKRDIFTLYFPIIKTNFLIGCFDTPYFYLKDIPSHCIPLVWANEELPF